jgi:uncharacterized membrane protein
MRMSVSLAIRPAAPLHPVFVHFTIALVAVSLFLDVAARLYGSASLSAAAWWTLAMSVPVTIITIISGIMSRRRVPIAEGVALRYLRLHVVLGPTFFGCLAAMAAWRAVLWTRAVLPGWWYLTALAVVTMLMAAQAYIGGELVYRFGVSVRGGYARLALHRSESHRPDALAAGPSSHAGSR